MRFQNSSVGAISCIVAGLLVPAWLGLGDHPDISVHPRPLRTHAGRIRADAPPGQLFFCEGSGLSRIDVALISLGQPNAEIGLVVREGDSQGSIVRRAAVLPRFVDEPEFIPFAFDPIPESSGRWYHFELAPSAGHPSANHAPWIRFHGQVGRDNPWGNKVFESRTVGSSFTSPLSDLRAVAVACEDLSTARGDVRLNLWEPGQEKKPLRSIQLPHPTVVESGYAFFSFEPIADSAGRAYSFRVTSKVAARFNGRNVAPSFKTYHGVSGSTPGLRGMTSSGQSLPDRDLVFRAWSSYGRLRGLSVANARAGWRVWTAVICWTASTLALARLFIQLRARDPVVPERPSA